MTAVFVISTFVIALSGLNVSTGEAIQIGIAKLVVLSALSLTTLWCARQMRGHMHNAILNSHRSNALKTIGAFAEGANDDANLRNTLILHCARAAFKDHPTGFEQKPSNEDSSSTKMAEMAMDIATSQLG